MIGPAKDEFVPHPVKDQLPGVDYCINSNPSWAEAIILGFQHYLVMLGTAVIIPTIIVPQMGGGNVEKVQVIQTLLFVSGVNTLLQSWFGTRLPVVIGGSFRFIIPAVFIALSNRYNTYLDPHQRFKQSMRSMQGALMISSVLPILAGFLGVWRIVTRFLCPLSKAPLVLLVGIGLYEQDFPLLGECVEIGLPELVLLILLSQFIPHMWKLKQPIFERFAVLLSVGIVWGFASLLTVAGAYKNRLRSVAELIALGLLVDLHGLSMFLNGLWGNHHENIGLLAMTRIGSRRVIQISAVFMLFFSVLGKFGAILASIPLPIIGALYCVLFALMSAAGFDLLQFCYRTKFILGFSIYMGLSVPQYFKGYVITTGRGPVQSRSATFDQIMQVIFTSPATVAGVIAYFLDTTLARSHPLTWKDSGRHWWAKFKYFGRDPRSEEFYFLPYGLSKYFPSV
ncbi:unnamed protein product [Withania somnifera]